MEPRNIKTLKLLNIKTLKDIRNYYKNTHNIEKWLNHSTMTKGDKKPQPHWSTLSNLKEGKLVPVTEKPLKTYDNNQGNAATA